MNPSLASSADKSFGILTLATPGDYLKAIGMALSARVSNPGVPLAVACSPKVAQLIGSYFDIVVEEKKGLRGFVHKMYLDEYSPFRETFFFDADVLLFKSVMPYVEQWRQYPYAACGKYQSTGRSTFGMDRAEMLRKTGKERLVVIDGAGHAYFRKPDCDAVFDAARDVTARHKEFMGDIQFADEDVMDVVMTKLDIPPMPYGDFFSRYVSARPGSMKMDATAARCEFIYKDTGEVMAPCMMHFAANEAPFPYHYQLHKLFSKFGVKTPGLLRSAMDDFYEGSIHLPLYQIKQRVLGRK